jgi:uncharacterized repeat protein (TIGR01451 family)/MYXO-CTERM domain-containing protein
MPRALMIAAVLVWLAPAPARATQFTKGSLIIPMDTTYQDAGMLRAFGLLYQLLAADVPVHWVIKLGKQLGDADFTVDTKDFASSAAITAHGYRGGPFVVEVADAAKATPVVTAWQQNNPTTAVHVAEAGFTARTARLLTAAPTIAVIADGHEDIAFNYLNAAGIPDRNGATWSNNSPDVLTIAAIAGPTTTAHNDGALFTPSGLPAFCQIMTMHWGVNQVVAEVVAEYRAFLQFPTHMMAECQAVNAIENHANGRFLTPNGFIIDNNVKETGPFAFLHQDNPFTQMDGPYALVKGSERAYTLPAGDVFHDMDVVMIKDATTTLGVRSIWMTGYIDGQCTIGSDDVVGGGCKAGVGKISYLGGHEYETKLPISTNPKTQGTRLFLNSLFEASCTTDVGQPVVTLTKSGPSWTTTSQVTYTLSYTNSGPGAALGVELSDTLPAGATYVSATGGGALSGSTVTWAIGDLGPGASGSVQLTVDLAAHGVYTNQFEATFAVGVNTKSAQSAPVTTSYQASAPDLGVADGPAAPDGPAALDAGPADAPPYLDGDVLDGPAVLDGPLQLDVVPADFASVTDGGTPDATPADAPASTEGSPAADAAPGDGGGTDETGTTTDAGPGDGGGTGETGITGDGPQGDGPPPGGGEEDGCSCRLGGKGSTGTSALLLLLLCLGALVGRRRRR